MTDEEKKELAELITQSVAVAVEAAMTKPRYGWNSTGSSWVRARGERADVYTASAVFPPQLDPWGDRT